MIRHLVGEVGYQKWALLICPCGCRETIMLSLAQNTRPRWSAEVDHKGRPMVYPSVRQIDGCYSHFWLRNWVIEWCEDTGEPLDPHERPYSKIFGLNR